jgi:DNA-binding MarR family transcriptional regulator
MLRKPGLVSSDTEQAREFAELFRAVYLTFHRRDAPRSQMPNASLAVLEHLALAGPLTIGEAAAHLRRAQSVVSEIVSHLESQGMLERESDPRDRRRTLVWLTAAGHDTLRRQREVLSLEQLAGAFRAMPQEESCALLRALRSLVQSSNPSPAAAGTYKGDHRDHDTGL